MFPESHNNREHTRKLIKVSSFNSVETVITSGRNIQNVTWLFTPPRGGSYPRRWQEVTVSKRKDVVFTKDTVPISEKVNLTLEEAAAYFNIGMGKIRELSNTENCPFVLWVGSKRMIKRKKMEAFLDGAYSI